MKFTYSVSLHDFQSSQPAFSLELFDLMRAHGRTITISDRGF